MTSATTTQTYWTDLRFAFPAESLDSAGEAVDHLIEAADRLGFRFELGHTTSEAPVDE